MKEVPLSHGKIALVDDEDYDLLTVHKWQARQTPQGLWYAQRPIRKADGVKSSLLLHRFLMNPPKGMHIDHKNRNTLDCQRSNLRQATRAQNNQNVGLRTTNTSGYKGVCYNRKDRQWRATIKAHGKAYYLGEFKSAKDAALVYDEAASRLHGEFAWLNFPREQEGK